MLEFHFRISMSKNSIKFFPLSDDFPFRLEETESGTLTRGIQRSFERLVSEQEIIRRWPMDERRINKLINDLNGYMINTGAMWTIVNQDLREGQFFLQKTSISMPSIQTMLYHQRGTLVRPRGFVNFNDQTLVNEPNRYCETEKDGSLGSSNKMSKFFRPWQ